MHQNLSKIKKLESSPRIIKNFLSSDEIEKLLKLYKLPTNLKNIINKKNIKNLKNLKEKIFKNIFLDKKKINKYPRYVNLVSVGKSKITEMKDFKRIKETINQIIF